PETAFPVEIDKRRSTYPMAVSQLLGKVKEWDSTLVTGGYGYGFSSSHPDKVTNAFFIMEPETGIQGMPYFKTHLLAFGEYVPGSGVFPELKNWIPAGDFAHGEGPAVKKINGIHIGPQICYESLFPLFTKSLADQGANIIVN